MNIMNALHTVGLNPFGVQLVAESLLKSPVAPRSADGEPLTFFFPVKRDDCAGWIGVEITLKAVRETETPNVGEECPAVSCDECHERGACTAEENRRNKTSKTPNAKVSGAGTASAGLPGYADVGNGEKE